MKREITIYVLELENGFFYVGKTYDIKNRLKRHSKGTGSAWTKIHLFERLFKQYTFDIEKPEDEEYWENFITLKFMKEKGWKKVRGGYWCNIGEYETIKNLQSHNHFLRVKIDEIKFNIRTYTIFALRLEEDKFYIGYSTNFKLAKKNHLKGKASKWTKMYKPIKVLETWSFESENGKIDMNFVDEKVHTYFEKYLAVNVRGGSYIIMNNELHLKKVKSGSAQHLV
jgi:predicted GIY-YIG superfamily endonuclease